MKRLTRAALLAAGALLLTACASDSGGSTPPSSTPAGMSSVTASSDVPGSGVGPAPHTAPPTSPTASSASTAAALDAQSVAWFDALCSEIAPITAVQNIGDDSSGDDSPGDDSPGDDAAARWRAQLNELRTLSQAFSATSTRLAATAPPTFDGGTDFAGKLTTGLSSAASTLTAAAGELDAVDPTDATALAAAQPVFKINVLEAISALKTVSQLDPSVVAAVRGIPSCQILRA